MLDSDPPTVSNHGGLFRDSPLSSAIGDDGGRFRLLTAKEDLDDMRLLTTVVSVLALSATTAAFAQSDSSMSSAPPPGPTATMQPVANPPAKARAATRHRVKHQARKHHRSHKPAMKAPSDTMATPAPPPPPPTGAPPHSN